MLVVPPERLASFVQESLELLGWGGSHTPILDENLDFIESAQELAQQVLFLVAEHL